MKILDSLTFALMSNPIVNNALFASSSTDGPTLYWRRANGNLYDLAVKNGRINVLTYTGSLSNISYKRPFNLKYIKVIAVGAGGGGGSGAARTANAYRSGGGGGGGGAIIYAQLGKLDLTATCFIDVGAGGAGGAAKATGSAGALVTGDFGGNGGNTIFRKSDGTVLVRAEGGKGGLGGSGSIYVTAAHFGAWGGSTSASIPSYSPFSIPGIPGGGLSATTNNAIGRDGGDFQGGGGAQHSFVVTQRVSTATQISGVVFGGGAAGGAGGGWGGLSPFFYTSGTGSGVLTPSGIVTGGFPGSASSAQTGSNGQSNIGVNYMLHFPLELTTTFGLGCGGGGGGSNGGGGGNGGSYGAGGGGGGAGTTLSGAGGSGSAGILYLIEYF